MAGCTHSVMTICSHDYPGSTF